LVARQFHSDHRHAFEYVGVELTDATFNVVAPDGQRRSISQKRGASYFLPHGTTHIEGGVSSNPPRHAVIVDLKDATAPSYANSSGLPTAFAEGVARKVAENQRVTVWDRTWPSGESAPAHFYARNAFVIFVDGGELTSSSVGTQPQALSVSAGQVLFKPGGRALSERSTKGHVRGIIVELK